MLCLLMFHSHWNSPCIDSSNIVLANRFETVQYDTNQSNTLEEQRNLDETRSPIERIVRTIRCWDTVERHD